MGDAPEKVTNVFANLWNNVTKPTQDLVGKGFGGLIAAAQDPKAPVHKLVAMRGLAVYAEPKAKWVAGRGTCPFFRAAH